MLKLRSKIRIKLREKIVKILGVRVRMQAVTNAPRYPHNRLRFAADSRTLLCAYQIKITKIQKDFTPGAQLPGMKPFFIKNLSHNSAKIALK